MLKISHFETIYLLLIFAFLNNLYYAHPVLEHLGVKATIYVKNGYNVNQRLMLTDKMEHLILSLPHDHLFLTIPLLNVSSLTTASPETEAAWVIRLGAARELRG